MDSPDKEETFDLREYKKRRGNRKGTITNVVKLFEPFKTYSLDDLNAEDLSRITPSVEEAVQNYNEEQSAIEEFQEESRYSGEDVSDAGQSTINLKLCTSVRDLTSTMETSARAKTQAEVPGNPSIILYRTNRGSL